VGTKVHGCIENQFKQRFLKVLQVFDGLPILFL